MSQQAFDRFKQQVLKDGPRLGPGDTFRFRCHRGLACFNQCCHDVNILLTPYDVIRMKRRLGMASEDFLDRYCVAPIAREQRLPVVLLKMNDDDQLACPFLREGEGCSIYADRPWSCRMYPLGRAAPPPDSKEGGEFHFLVHEDFCLGAREAGQWTVAQWLDDQGVAEYDRLGRRFQEIAQHPKLRSGAPLGDGAMDMLFMACYDLDRFRRFVFGTKFLASFDIAEKTIAALRDDDVALMEFGFDWLRFALWQEPTLRIRDEVLKAKKAELGVVE